MVALSGLVFALSWWLGLYLLARDPRKPVLALAAVGLTSFALVVALDAVRLVSQSAVLGSVEIYLVAVPGIAWLAVLLELSRPRDSGRSRAAEVALVTVVAATAVLGATLAGDVDGPLRLGHWVMFGALSVPVLAALVHAVTRRAQPRPVVGFVIVATLFFALGNAILIIPLGMVPSWVALASTGVDIALLGVAVAIGDAFDEGHALRKDMLRSFAGTTLAAVLFGGQVLIGIAVAGSSTTLTVLLFGPSGVWSPCQLRLLVMLSHLRRDRSVLSNVTGEARPILAIDNRTSLYIRIRTVPWYVDSRYCTAVHKVLHTEYSCTEN